jgi:AcrR family transcriptional regulator
MSRPGKQPIEPRLPLNRERVLRAAIALADEGGIEALSMRKIARELGVEAMSLYNHVANKDEILRGISDLVTGEIELPPDGTDWKACIRRHAISTRDTFVRHPWASGLRMSPRSGGPARLERSDWLLRTLREAGLSAELTYHAFHILESYILGFTFQQLSFPHSGEELAGMAERFLEKLSSDEYPDFVEHVHQHLVPHEGDEGGFELGLDLILDSLERLRDAP